MKSKDFLAKQLEETAKIIEWAITLVPEDRLLEVPPHHTHPKASDHMKGYFGLWSAYRLLFHLTFYEESYTLPTMKHWLGEPLPLPDEIDEEKAWKKELKKGVNLLVLLNRFHSVRKQQREVVNSIQEEHWTEERATTVWKEGVSVEFIVSKIIQHTLEHGNKLSRIALYWDRLWDWLNQLEKEDQDKNEE